MSCLLLRDLARLWLGVALSIPRVLSIAGLQGFVAMLVFLLLTKGWGLSDILNTGVFFCRFGSFEIFKPPDEYTGRAGPSVGRNDIRVQMLDYVISSFYPEIQAAHTCDSDNIQRNAAFFREVGRFPTGPPQ